MKISIITEGFHNTGYGHITRCQSIYQAFEERNLTPTIYVNGDESCKPFLMNTNYELINWLENSDTLFDKIVGSGIVIVDSYLASLEFYNKISSLTALPVFIDDNMRLEYPSGVVINGAVNAELMKFESRAGVTYLLGPKYVPLRKPFWQALEKIISPDVQSVMITFGGQDTQNMTPRMLRMFVRNFPELKKIVIVGSGYNNLEQINEIKDENTELVSSPSAEEMLKVMLECDVAITAAGQTVYELARVGVPTIAVSVAENQNNNLAGWLKEQFLLAEFDSKLLNLENHLQVHFITYFKREQRTKVAYLGRKKVDGQGANRIAQALIDMIISKNGGFYFRTALDKDVTDVFNLANEKSVRLNSINQGPIILRDHTFWYSQKIIDPNIIFLLAFNSTDNFIGQVRFDIKENYAVINIALCKNFRGKRLSVPLIRAGSLKCFGDRNEVEYILAYIKPANIPSVKSFAHSAFVRFKEEMIDDERYFVYKLIRKK
jgi:UDP-2,4-diacetamido-2,4,6-trideoxy-beta-L-altropyranose hydrolase